MTTTDDPKSTAGKLATLKATLAETINPTGAATPEGRLTPRQRIDALLDEATFTETDALAKHRSTAFGMDAHRPATDGVVTGYGRIDGRKVCVYAQDASVFGGAMGEVHGEKIVKLYDLAIKTGVPIISIHDGGGARIEEGVVALAMYSKIFQRATVASGLIPQIAVIPGTCAGGNAATAALADFTIMVDHNSTLSITGPGVVKDSTSQDLGGATVHEKSSGTSHYTAANEEDAFAFVKQLVGFLPQNNRSETPRTDADIMTESISDSVTPTDLELDGMIPDSSHDPYDMHEVIRRIVDDGCLFLETQARYARNIITGFGRVEGRAVGIVANQPTVKSGCLDAASSDKAARFIRTCDSFNIPLLELVDVPGFLPDPEQEAQGLARRSAALIHAFAEATVGKVTVIVRKSYGDAYCVMGSKDMGADIVLAWPTAEIAITDAATAVGFVNKKDIAKRVRRGENEADVKKEFVAHYADTLINPYAAAERGLVDAVIPPSETRGRIVEALRLLDRKVIVSYPKKHGNIPL